MFEATFWEFRLFFPAAAQTPKRIEAAPDCVCAFLIHEARGSAEVGLCQGFVRGLSGEPPPAAGRALRRTLAGLQGVGWECETRRPFPLGVEGWRRIDSAQLHHLPEWPCVGVGLEGPFAKMPPDRCPRTRYGSRGGGTSLVKGCLNTCAGQREEACVGETHPQCPERQASRLEQVGTSLHHERRMPGAYL